MYAPSYKTRSLSHLEVEKNWVVIDAQDQVLGRLATAIAFRLRGKHKPSFTPHISCGDRVIVLNADKVKVTGNKELDKDFVWHTGYPGGQRTINIMDQRKKDASKIIERAVRGMLPKNRLGAELFRNLYVYNGNEHPHEAQKPETITLS